MLSGFEVLVLQFTVEDYIMNRAISFVLLAGGIVFIILGINASNSSASDFSRFFTGSATDKSLWMLAGGILATVLGLAGLSPLLRKK